MYKPGLFTRKFISFKHEDIGRHGRPFSLSTPPQRMVACAVSDTMWVKLVEIAFGFVFNSSKPVLIPHNEIKTH
jgi:hypothetical protein